MYELWRLNAAGVREVRPFARIKILDFFMEIPFGVSFTFRQLAASLSLGVGPSTVA